MKTEPYEKKSIVLKGKVIGAGGNPPKVQVVIFGAGTVSFETTQEWACKLALYIYQEIEVEGMATLNKHGELKSFAVERIL